MNPISDSPADLYWQHLAVHCPVLDPQRLTRLQADLKATDWDEPQTALDFNNLGVMALIEAEQSQDVTLRAMGLEMALEALTQGAEIQPGHPLCAAHLALVRSLIGEMEPAMQVAFPTLLNLLHYTYNASEPLPMGLVYLPTYLPKGSLGRPEALFQILHAEEGCAQALRLLAEVMCQHIHPVFYNAGGRRFTQLALQVMPNSVELHLKLGLANLMAQQWEGLIYLQQARTLAPQLAPVIQVLHLVYRELSTNLAEYWLQYGRDCAQTTPEDLAWRWTTLSTDSPFTYVPFEQNLLMAVDPSIRSIVTSVLLTEGDWFEAEMEFWRTQLQPGMTVIDVGANVGVYTFSAAQQVGPTGRVFAIEPFSGCVRCLQETQRLNQLNWVTICAGAASDQQSTARLSLRAASELNEVVTDADAAPEGEFEEITCFPLDSLIEREQITRVDWLKIDAEGHEMQVLAGSERLLKEFAPGIIYENIAGESVNTSVAAYLQSKGYQLFCYQPYLQNLVPAYSAEEIRSSLNVIALPASRT